MVEKRGYEVKGIHAFVCCFLLGVIILLPYIIQSGGFLTFVNDYNYQQIPFNMYCIEAIRNGNVLWDWNTDLGGNFVGNYAFYTLGSPFFWLISLFPAKMVPYLLGPVLALKYGVAGLTAFWFIRRYTCRTSYALLGAVLYAFSGFQAGNLLFNHFHDAVAFFPLLLIGLDKLTEEKKKGFFALTVALNATTNFFFFAGEVVFLGIYYFLKIVWDDRKKIRTIGSCLLEGLIGTGMSCFIFYPALLFTLSNPRVSSHLPVREYFIFEFKHYIRLLKAILLPMEAMTSASTVDVYVFSSTSLYLPMVGIILAACFFIGSRKDRWMKRVLCVCAIIIIIPVLNSVFYAFNSSYAYYTRWLYMPILILCLASVKGLELERMPLKKTAVLLGALFMVLVVLLLNLFGEESYILHKFRALLLFAISIGGLTVTFFLLYRKNRKKTFQGGLIAGVMLFSVITNSYVILVMRDTAPVIHYTDGVKAFHEAASSLKIEDENQDWRVMYSNRKGNLPLLMNVPSVNSWNSTVSGEIFKLYALLGGDREFDSPTFGISCEPGKALLSVKYEILSSEELQRWEGEDQKKELLAEFDTTPFEVYVYERGFGIGDYKQYTNQYKFYLYKNENFLPIGFAYDFYITEEELLLLPEEKRPYAMLRAIVLPDNEVKKVEGYLEHMESTELENLDDEHMQMDLEERRESSSKEFSHDTASVYSVIDSNKKQMAFFSVPYDKSWRAYVNGEAVEIINSAGMMAVPIEEGSNTITFRYLALDNIIGGGISVLSCILYVVYIGINNRKYKKL